MHPGRFGTDPVGQEAAAIKSGIRPSLRRLLNGNEVIFINPVFIIDEGSELSIDFWNRLIERMRFAGGWNLDHA